MATMGKYVVAYELAIKTVRLHSFVWIVLTVRIGGTRAKSRDPSLNRPLTSVSSTSLLVGPELTLQVTCRDTSVVISISIPSRKLPLSTYSAKLRHSAHAVEAHEKPGVLSKKNFDESVIPDEQRIPRATSANW